MHAPLQWKQAAALITGRGKLRHWDIGPSSYPVSTLSHLSNETRRAEAIAIAALQEGMRFVPVKTADQQALTVLIKTRALFIRQRTKAFNAIRSHLAEFGLIVGTGTVRLEALARFLDGDQTGRVPKRSMRSQRKSPVWNATSPRCPRQTTTFFV